MNRRYFLTSSALSGADAGYADSILIFEVRHYSDTVGNLGKQQEPTPAASDGGMNWANFIASVRRRKRPDLNADVERSYLSTPRMRLANTLHFDSQTPQRTSDKEADAMFTRKYPAGFAAWEV